ncbi:hypothetical protein LCGC14_1025450 [marine sediment metagenome]|uniref:Uncharacterized protein n=2 Tax=root TaxID=1 RepID=A0A831VUH9_9FLAO|nr:hypothetical protein [Pricia antarctica]
MSQDLREVFKKEREDTNPGLKPGHKKRFQERLEKQFPQQRHSWILPLKIAASIIIALGIGSYFLTKNSVEMTPPSRTVNQNTTVEGNNTISLGDLTPGLKKMEQYYVTNINYELSKIEISSENKTMVDGFMQQLGILNAEYVKLNTELNSVGPNDKTITALIKNLQLRLQLLQDLKKKLNYLKTVPHETLKTSSM